MLLLEFLLLLLIKFSLQASTPSSPSYIAAVVEFNVGPLNRTSAQLLSAHVQEYLAIMDEAPDNIDIIVYPESALNNYFTAPELPDPDKAVSPCEDSSFDSESFIKQISCSARKHKRYVVINITAKAKCPDPEMIASEDPRNCTERSDGFSYYNTNVIFDRNGAIISTYRKFNLWAESVDRPHKPAMATFETDFGVKFGHFICFDILFRYPAHELVQKHNVTDVIFPALWFSELPFLTAVQVQQNWAHASNVNLLAAGTNNPRAGSTGSGIFSGRRGALVAEMSPQEKTRLYTAVVPKIGFNFDGELQRNVVRHTEEEMQKLRMNGDQLQDYAVAFISDTSGSHRVEQTACQNDTCCTAKVNYTVANSQRPHYQYALAFYGGERTFDRFANATIAVCSLVACLSKSVLSCGLRNETFESAHQWTALEISLTRDARFFYMPNTLDTSLLPLQPELFGYASERQKVVMHARQNVGRLMAFGIYGIDFDLEEATSAGINERRTSAVICAAAFVALLLSR